MDHFKILSSFIEEINLSNSTLHKKEILHKYKNNETIKKFLYYTYNP